MRLTDGFQSDLPRAHLSQEDKHHSFSVIWYFQTNDRNMSFDFYVVAKLLGLPHCWRSSIKMVYCPLSDVWSLAHLFVWGEKSIFVHSVHSENYSLSWTVSAFGLQLVCTLEYKLQKAQSLLIAVEKPKLSVLTDESTVYSFLNWLIFSKVNTLSYSRLKKNV